MPPGLPWTCLPAMAPHYILAIEVLTYLDPCASAPACTPSPTVPTTSRRSVDNAVDEAIAATARTSSPRTRTAPLRVGRGRGMAVDIPRGRRSVRRVILTRLHQSQVLVQRLPLLLGLTVGCPGNARSNGWIPRQARRQEHL